MKKWVKLKEEIIFEHPRLILTEHRVKLPNGAETDYLTYKSYKDFPTIIALNDEGEILVTKEPAYPVNEMLFQFPEGVPDDGETIETAARRELLEETGYDAESLTEIATNLHEHRRSLARQHTLVARNLKLSDNKLSHDQEEEGIIVQWLTEDEIWTLIKENKIIQKNTLAAWASYQAHKRD